MVSAKRKTAIFALAANACIVLTACGTGLRGGDLVFVSPRAANAITAVTHGAAKLPIDHVAIYDGTVFIEALPMRGVCLTPADSFYAAHRGDRLLIGRLRRGRADLRRSLDNARQYLCLPYDSLYCDTDSAIYCSELVQKSYVDAKGRRLFATVPMEFRDSTGAIPRRFTEFYGSRGLDVPEGLPGSNPGQLSRHPAIKIKVK